MVSRNKEKYLNVNIANTFGMLSLTAYMVIILLLYGLIFSSCATIAPNTYAALEALPEGALTPLWMVLEGVFLDLVSLVKGLIF